MENTEIIDWTMFISINEINKTYSSKRLATFQVLPILFKSLTLSLEKKKLLFFYYKDMQPRTVLKSQICCNTHLQYRVFPHSTSLSLDDASSLGWMIACRKWLTFHYVGDVPYCSTDGTLSPLDKKWNNLWIQGC